MSFKVLLACYSEWDTSSEIPYLLKKANCSVDVFCSSKSWLISNLFHDQWYEAPNSIENYCTELCKIYKSNNYNWVILVDDPLIRYMNIHIADELFQKIMPILTVNYRKLLSLFNFF